VLLLLINSGVEILRLL